MLGRRGRPKQDGVRVPGEPGVKDCLELCVSMPLGFELKAGRRERVPGVLGHLVTTRISFWADFLPHFL